MSHYAVAVFSNDDDTCSFDELLEPYSENNKKYYEFIPVDINEKYQKNASQRNLTLDQFVEESGYIKENGVYGYRCNPNAKYDYYTLDGRDYLFEVKPGEELDSGFYRKSQIDFLATTSKADLKRAAIFWDNYVIKRNSKISDIYKPEYYLERYKTKEQYLKEMTYTVPYAFVTPDGKWHAPGTVGWFASSDETAESMNAYLDEWLNYIADINTDPYVSIVDCHI